MGGLTYEQQMKWRRLIENEVLNRSDKSVTFIHPPQFYQYNSGVDEREAREWDLNQIKNSDIVVINLSDIADSIGSHMELGLIEGMNEFGYKHIFVVGIGEPNTDHPWIELSLSKKVSTIQEAADYIVNYLLL